MSDTLTLSSVLTSKPLLSEKFPAWFRDRQQQVWEKFLTIPTPKRGDELWRFASFGELDFSEFILASEDELCDADEIISRSQGVEKFSAKFVFYNDQLIHSETKLPAGVICVSLAEAIVSHPALVKEYFMRRDAKLGSTKFVALHEANVKNGVFILVPKNIEIDDVIEVFHWSSGDHVANFPHTLIITESNAKVRVVDTFLSVDDASKNLVIAVNDLILGDGSKLDYVAIQALNENSKIIQVNETSVATNALATGFLVNLGACYARAEAMSRLEGEGSRSNMFAISIPSSDQEYDQRTFQHHISPGANSDLLYKNSLYGNSRTIFSGLIFVDENAHRTDAYQTCRNLLMSDDAEANSMPGLEINADDVKCSHGSTTSQISDEEVFYLRARGVPGDISRQLIARGFSIEVISRLNHEPIENLILRYVDKKFAKIII
jgi:Fe-S cluster assembly protein SufD